jgi:hypothetical protein
VIVDEQLMHERKSNELRERLPSGDTSTGTRLRLLIVSSSFRSAFMAQKARRGDESWRADLP